MNRATFNESIQLFAIVAFGSMICYQQVQIDRMKREQDLNSHNQAWQDYYFFERFMEIEKKLDR